HATSASQRPRRSCGSTRCRGAGCPAEASRSGCRASSARRGRWRCYSWASRGRPGPLQGGESCRRWGRGGGARGPPTPARGGAAGGGRGGVVGPLDGPLEEGMGLEQDLYVLLQTTADRREGVRSFLERRTPRYEGR